MSDERQKTPPPRRRKSSTIRREDIRSSVEILQQMGFDKLRAEKAIAATGDRGVQLASDWLLSHVNDPLLDTHVPRQYILYLCPVGPLQEELMEFWEKSLQACGWNGSHTYFPHITLSPFFTVTDSKARGVKDALRSLEPLLDNCPGPVKLDFFAHNNYIGLFLQEEYYKFLVDGVAAFVKECKKIGVTVEPTKKQLHLTLAYQYASEYNEELIRLARAIDLNAQCQWEVRLYSRDPRIGNSEVRKVKQRYKASLEDELDLIIGDYVFMDPNESTRSSDKWFHGTSWLTGQQGMFPGPYTERTAETWTWSMHGSELLITDPVPGSVMNGTSQVETNPAEAASGGPFDGYSQRREERLSVVYAKVDKLKRTSPETHNVQKSPPKEQKKPQQPTEPKEPRKLYVMRHAERMDFVFGRNWVDLCFDDLGHYKPSDLNMPKTVPKRTNTHLENSKDAPLTALGQFQAHLTGEALRETGVVFSHVYVSPALRCVQTVTGVLKSMGQSPVLRIEPGLFEWLGWYQLGLPHWFSPAELKAHGFNVDVSYKPFIPVSKFDMEEKIQGYYRRSGETARHVLNIHQNDGGNVLLVGHAGSVEVCTRQLLGSPPRSDQDFRDLCSKVPYCGLLSLGEDIRTRKWSVLEMPIKTLTHGHNKKDNVKRLLYPS